jgi:nucleoid-associated protein YgaU
VNLHAAAPEVQRGGALPPRTELDSRQWMTSRQAAPKSRSLKVVGSVVVGGMLAALGWVGYQQMHGGAVANAEQPGGTPEFTFDGDTAAPSTPTPLDAAQPPLKNTARETFAAEEAESPAVTSFRRGASSHASKPTSKPEEPADSDNPFARFHPPVQTAHLDELPANAFERKPKRLAAPIAPEAGTVILAGSEAPATHLEPGNPFGSQQTEPMQAEPAGNPFGAGPIETAATSRPQTESADPFASFPQNVTAEAPSTVPAPFGAQMEPAETASSVPSQFGARNSQVVAEAEWATAPATPPVTQVQYQGSAPAPFSPPAQLEQARPVNEQPGLASDPFAPAVAPGQFGGRPYQQPAQYEPGAAAAHEPRRFQPKPATATLDFSDNRAQPTGFDVPQPVKPANDPRDETLHVVQQGETWWNIARQHYGAGRYFQALADYNDPRISKTTQLKPGMKVLVPSAATLDARYGKQMQVNGLAKPVGPAESGLKHGANGPYYVVGQGDTLGSIAQKCLGTTKRTDELFRLNQSQLPNEKSLKVGMSLIMPTDAGGVEAASSIPGRR